MNYYIDFDNTLFETAKLTEAMLKSILDSISINNEEVLNDVKNNFDSSNDNIFTYAEKMANKYNIDCKLVINNINNIIDNCGRFVYEDSERFLNKLKKEENKVVLLTFIPKMNQEYQLQKIKGSGLAKYFDTMILTTELKYTLDINYENGVFIDDNPRDLEGLNSMNPLRLIRMRRLNNKRSKIEMNIENMEEYETFDAISLDFNK
jgi:FMN phosphatase YigB (HAD superfamily)